MCVIMATETYNIHSCPISPISTLVLLGTSSYSLNIFKLCPVAAGDEYKCSWFHVLLNVFTLRWCGINTGLATCNATLSCDADSHSS